MLGETSGKPRTEREEWWWKDEVQLVLKKKKELKKQWEQTILQADKVEYRRKKKEAKRTVAVARAEVARELCEELKTVEEQKKIYRIAKNGKKSNKRHQPCEADERWKWGGVEGGEESEGKMEGLF